MKKRLKMINNKLYTFDEVVVFIKQDRLLSLAGDFRVLDKLPPGNWIAGTTPYFMDDIAKFNQNLIFVTCIEMFDREFKIDLYDEHDIENIVKDSYENGYTMLIIPLFQKVHKAYAIKTKTMVGLYNNPIVGWVSGGDLFSTDVAKTYYGPNGKSYKNKAVAIHVKLPDTHFAQIDIINIFEPSLEKDVINFYEDGFRVDNCIINGKDTNFAAYIEKKGIDISNPLIADYLGASINVSIKEINNGVVNLFAPVFSDTAYRFPENVSNYIEKFEEKTKRLTQEYAFSCNCVLNYVYGELKGKKINNVIGPLVFGEIGYKLLNQTLVNLEINKISK